MFYKKDILFYFILEMTLKNSKKLILYHSDTRVILKNSALSNVYLAKISF